MSTARRGGQNRLRLAVSTIAALTTLLASSCKLDRIAVPEGRDGLVVHAVVDSKTLVVDVLVESLRVYRQAVRVLGYGGNPVVHEDDAAHARTWVTQTRR